MRKIQFRVLILALVLLASIFLLWFWFHPKPQTSETLPVFYRLAEETDRLQFLAEQSYALEPSAPVRSCPVTIPESPETESSSVYQTYLRLQTEQRLPYYPFYGCTAMEYTYTLQDATCISLLLSEDGLLLAAVHYDTANPQNLLPVLASPESLSSSEST